MRPTPRGLTMAAATAAAAAAAVAAAVAGCETFSPAMTCDLTEGAPDNPLVVYAGGTTTPDDAGVYTYTSLADAGVDAASQLLYLPGGMYYGLETGLPCAPWSVAMYLSFEVDGGAVAQASGNEVLLLGLAPPGGGGDGDGYTIQVASNSCSTFWLWVTAQATCPP